MIADTRTNAGLDNISTYRKLSLIGGAWGAGAGPRVSREPVSIAIRREPADRGTENSDTGEIETLRNAPTLFAQPSW